MNGPGGIFHQSSPGENESYSIFFEGKTKKTIITLKKKRLQFSSRNCIGPGHIPICLFSIMQTMKKERKKETEREGKSELTMCMKR